MTMPCLPYELVESIIDFLHDNPEALKQCSLVSKSWAFDFARPRLFNHIHFKHREHLDAWKKNFMGSKTSPAIYTHSLCFHNAKWVPGEDIYWIRSFTKVKQLEIVTGMDLAEGFGPTASLVPFRSLSSVAKVRSLCLGWDVLPLYEVFDLICSFPLENLHIIGNGRIVGPDNLSSVAHSSRLLGMTGTLVLEPERPNIAQELSELPFGLQFRKIVHKHNAVTFKDTSGIIQRLVEKCADTLESIEIRILNQIVLSKATKLKEAGFWFDQYHAEQVAATLDTITAEGFKQLSIHFNPGRGAIGVELGGQMDSEWRHLDRVLGGMRSVCLKIVWYGNAVEGGNIERLLPETTERGFELDLQHSKDFLPNSRSKNRWYSMS